MSNSLTTLADALKQAFAGYQVEQAYGELTLVVPPGNLLPAMQNLRDTPSFGFEQLMDLAVVDYLHFGLDEWAAEESTATGFSRGVETKTTARLKFGDAVETRQLPHPRFAVVYHLLSLQHNRRLRVKVFAPDNDMPRVSSVIGIWESADWFEREAFDLYGVLFEGHPDLRRILTDYGFIGHPFRKDFPLIGNVEMRYDPDKKRVIYQPVSIEPRVLVPKVVRHDNRYLRKGWKPQPTETPKPPEAAKPGAK
ncbi:MAG TPA: NADH-quinone oxidoreductase subunit C [Gammaproteobacteria bacterium]